MKEYELSKADDSVIIVEYIITYSAIMSKAIIGMGATGSKEYLKRLNGEMLRRGILSEKQIKWLRV